MKSKSELPQLVGKGQLKVEKGLGDIDIVIKVIVDAKGAEKNED